MRLCLARFHKFVTITERHNSVVDQGDSELYWRIAIHPETAYTMISTVTLCEAFELKILCSIIWHNLFENLRALLLWKNETVSFFKNIMWYDTENIKTSSKHQDFAGLLFKIAGHVAGSAWKPIYNHILIWVLTNKFSLSYDSISSKDCASILWKKWWGMIMHTSIDLQILILKFAGG